MIFALIAALAVVAVSSIVALREAHARLARSSERFLDALVAAADRNQANWESTMAQLRDVHAAWMTERTVTREELLRVLADHREEVQALLQRIQAPELAVIQHQQEQAGPDESYPLTDEETAEMQERHLALERLERLEREGVLS